MFPGKSLRFPRATEIFATMSSPKRITFVIANGNNEENWHDVVNTEDEDGEVEM